MFHHKRRRWVQHDLPIPTAFERSDGLVRHLQQGHRIGMIGKRIGNYVVERTLAQGGMGAVYVARDQALGRLAAIKFIGQDGECELDTARRFLDEARITASLQHPNVVTIFDYGELEGRLYYVMELLTGSDLAALSGTIGGSILNSYVITLLRSVPDYTRRTRLESCIEISSRAIFSCSRVHRSELS